MLSLAYTANGLRALDLASALILTSQGSVQIEAAGRRCLEWSEDEKMILTASGAEASDIEITSDERFTLSGPDGHCYENVLEGYRLTVIGQQLCLVTSSDDSISAIYLPLPKGHWYVSGSLQTELRLASGSLSEPSSLPFHPGPRQRRSSIAEKLLPV